MRVSSAQPGVAVRPGSGTAVVFPAGAVRVGRSRARWRRRGLPVAVPALYLGLSMLWVGRFALPAPAGGTIGAGPDVQIFLWGLRWWPYALGHGLDPLVSHVVWAPYGSGVLWTTTVPLLAVLAAPITLLSGPAAAWNVLCVLAPVLSAWAAYGLCLELTGDRRASTAGGLLFGFSSYELAEGIAHLQLTMAAFIPLVVLVVVRYARGRLSGPGLALRLGGLAAAEFLISPEVLTSLLLLGLLAAGVALVVLVDLRPRLIRGIGWSAVGLLGAGLLCAPELVQMLQTMPPGPLNPASSYSTDLLNLVVPTRVTAMSGSWSAPLAARFDGNLSEQTGYLGGPLLLIVLGFLRARRRDPAVRLLALVTGLALILSFGPELRVDGQPVVWMPYALLSGLPGLRDALPARFPLYVALGAAITVALWLSAARRRPGGWRWVALAAALACLLPSSSTQLWWRPTPSWIVHDELARIIPRGATVVWLPFWSLSDRGLYAQAVADFRFRLDDRWLQTIPTAYHAVANSSALDGPAADGLRRHERDLCALHADYAVVRSDPAGSAGPLADADLKPIRAGRLLVYRLPATMCRHAPR